MTLSIRLRTVRCISEENEASASEEPYILITAVHFRRPQAGLPAIPNARTNLHGPWEDFDARETRIDLSDPFWGLNAAPADIVDPGEVAFFISLMENDNGSPSGYRQLVEAAVAGSLGTTLGETDLSIRGTRVLTSIRNALDGIDLPIPFALDDDHIATEPRTGGPDRKWFPGQSDADSPR